MSDERWPALPYDAWKDTYATLHMWTQIVGKVALALAPPREGPAFMRDAYSQDAAFYHRELGEFILPYETVRTADSPEAAIRAFLESTYEYGANLAGWDRAALERRPPAAG